jgi:hypothetical protein
MSAAAQIRKFWRPVSESDQDHNRSGAVAISMILN